MHTVNGITNSRQNKKLTERATGVGKTDYAVGFLGNVLPNPDKYLGRRNSSKTETIYDEMVRKYPEIFQALYWPYWFWKNLTRFRLAFTDKFGSPTIVGKFGTGASKEEKETLLTVIKSVQNESGLIIPDTQQVDLMEAITKGKGTDPFGSYMEYLDEQTVKIILGQTLTSSTGSTGSFAMAKVHNEVRGDIKKFDADLLCQFLNSQLIKTLVDLNFAEVKHYPKIWINVVPATDQTELSNTLKTLSEIGAKIPKTAIEDGFGLDQNLPEGDYIIIGDTKVAAVTPPAILEAPNDKTAIELSVESGVSNHRYDLIIQGRDAVDDIADSGLLHDPYGEVRGKIKTALEANRYPTSDDLLGGDLGQALFKTILASRLNAVQSVLNDLRVTRTLGAVPEGFLPKVDGVEFAANEDYITTAITPQDALEWWSNKTGMAASDYYKLEAEARQQAFVIAGLQNEHVVEKLRKLIEESLRKGKTSPMDFVDEFNKLYGQLGIDPISNAHASLVFQNAMHDAYNTGRWRMYNRPSIKTIYDKYEYATAGDDRVRPSHEVMDGIIRPADDPIWLTWWPPNGHRCRCTVLAISIYESAKESSLPDSRIQPDDGWDKNSAILGN